MRYIISKMVTIAFLQQTQGTFHITEKATLGNIYRNTRMKKGFVRLLTGFGKTIITALLPFTFDYLWDAESHMHSVILCISHYLL